jgi:hypothetical protein
MERLLTRRPIHSGGTLDVSTLAIEAGVARQDLYRAYRPVLEEFRVHLRRLEAAGSDHSRHSEQVDRIRRQLDAALGRAERYRTERDAARSERDLNASQIVHLSEQNRLLREQVDVGAGVTQIHPD